MTPVLYGHPFSSYTQKVLIALYETATPFTWRVLHGPETFDEMAKLWPMRMRSEEHTSELQSPC